MSVTQARKRLHSYGDSGNWRFKALIDAALETTPVTAKDMARAWPGANKGDYRFLQDHDSRDPDVELSRATWADSGTERHRMLKDYALGADNLPKQLSSSKHLTDNGDSIEARLDSAIPKMLFAASDREELDTLFREQLLEVVQEGRKLKKVAREASNVINAQTRRGDVTVASDEEFAPPVAQGGEIRDNREQYDTVEWNCEKYAIGSRVTDEALDQANPDLIERNIQFTGAAVENSINRVFLTTLVDEANGNHDTEGSDQGYSALNAAVTEVDKEDFEADTYLTGPEYRGVLFDDPNLRYANRAGTDEILRDRGEASIVGNLLGLDMHAAASGLVYDDGTDEGWSGGENTFGFENDGELGAVVYNRSHIHTILYAPNGQDVEIKDYEDPIRDLQGLNARIHADADYSQERAAATIEY